MMSNVRRFAIFSFLLFLASPLTGQIVFSRRVYQEQDPSYQQIWTWDAANKVKKVLTHSQRDHYLPQCKNGSFTFVSPEEGLDASKLWSFNLENGQEHMEGPVPAPSNPAPPVSGCDAFAKVERLTACGKKEDLVLSRAGKAIAQFHIQANECPAGGHGKLGPCETPILSLEWSANTKWLLVRELGLNTNSSAPQSDYYVVETATMKLTKAASAFEAIWLPGRDEVVYTTPKGLVALPSSRRERNVWTQHLMVFDPATGKSTAITSGVTRNLNPSLCTK